MSEQKPTVGRIVHFYPNGAPEGEETLWGDQPYPAIITHVWSDDCVNLYVFPKQDSKAQADVTGPQTSVVKRGSPEDTSFAWDWPPRA